MDMEGVRSSIIAAALLFLTLFVLAASTSGGDDAAAAVEEKKKQCNPLAADEPYALVAFQNKDGEEIRLLADQRSSKQVSGVVSAFANRSGNWFYSGGIREGIVGGQLGKGNKGGRRLHLPQLNNRSRTAEGLWNTLGVLVNTTATASDSYPAAADDDDDDDDDETYMFVGMRTSGGDKIRVVVVADQRYFFITGFAKGFFLSPNWSFRDGERHRLLTTLGGNGSHAEVVASSVLAALMNAGKACW